MYVGKPKFKFWYFGIDLVFDKFQIVTTCKIEIAGRIAKTLENERETKRAYVNDLTEVKNEK